GADPCGPKNVPVMATAADVQQRIFICNCVFSGCHDSLSNRTLNFSLETMTSACAALRRNSCEFPALPRIDKNNPDNSFVIKKLSCAAADCTPTLGSPDPSCQITDTMTGAVLNQRMPATDPPLDSGRVQTLRTWIAMDLPGCPPATPDGGG